MAASLSNRQYNHDFVGIGALPEDQEPSHVARRLRVIRHTVNLGRGNRSWDVARAALLEWRMHDGSSWSAIHRDRSGSVVTLAALPHPRIPLLWVLNPCREVDYSLNAGDHCCVGYATLKGHLIAGEESMSVYRKASGEVCFEVLSRSRGANLFGRLIFLGLAKTQDRFFREQCRCMQALVIGDDR
eukprot:scaffold225179_cov30-Tisochrysis_lutea.AAC.1